MIPAQRIAWFTAAYEKLEVLSDFATGMAFT